MKNSIKISLLLLFLIGSAFAFHDGKGKKHEKLADLEEHLACLEEDQALKVSFENGKYSPLVVR